MNPIHSHQAGDHMELSLDLSPDVTLVFRYVPPCPQGFLMGSRDFTTSQPIHRVTLTEGFWLGETLVTQTQFACWTQTPDYADWLAANKEKLYLSKPHKNSFDHESPDRLPADNVSWYEARGFCEWLHEKGLTRGEGRAALPSEAQWEYACRAGASTEYWNGDGEASLQAVGWYDAISDNKTQPVRSKEPNRFGLFDLHGNLWEWCRDAWDDAAYQKRSPNAVNPEVLSSEAETSSSYRVGRGGAWFNSATGCRCASRPDEGGLAGDRHGGCGFRVALFPGPGGKQSS